MLSVNTFVIISLLLLKTSINCFSDLQRRKEEIFVCIDKEYHVHSTFLFARKKNLWASKNVVRLYYEQNISNWKCTMLGGVRCLCGWGMGGLYSVKIQNPKLHNSRFPVSDTPRITCHSPYWISLNANSYERERKETLGRTITFDTYIKIEK